MSLESKIDEKIAKKASSKKDVVNSLKKEVSSKTQEPKAKTSVNGK